MARYATMRRGRARISKVDREEAERRADEVLAAAAHHEASIALILSEVFKQLTVSAGSVFAARVAAGDQQSAMSGIAIARFREALADAFEEEMISLMSDAGAAAAEAWTEFDLGFDARTTDVLRQARQRSSFLVREVTNETHAGIRRAIAEAVERGDNARVAARSIRPLIGNLSRHVAAVERYRDSLIRRGLVRSKADELAGRYASRLLTYRTENIARTEILWGANASQHEYWIQLRNAGLIPQAVARIWVVSDDDRLCPQCAPLDGEIVGFDDEFVSRELGLPGEELRPRPNIVSTEFPPLHPSCRCTISLDTVNLIE